MEYGVFNRSALALRLWPQCGNENLILQSLSLFDLKSLNGEERL